MLKVPVKINVLCTVNTFIEIPKEDFMEHGTTPLYTEFLKNDFATNNKDINRLVENADKYTDLDIVDIDFENIMCTCNKCGKLYYLDDDLGNDLCSECNER